MYPSLIEWIYFLKGVIATLDEKNQSKDVKIKMLLMSKSNYSGHVKINLLKYMMKYDFSNTDTLGDLLGKHVWPNVKVLIKNWDVWFESPSSFCN